VTVIDRDWAVLGSTGLPVTRFTLGTATFGGQCDEKESHAILDRADDLGIAVLDTADKYPIGSDWDRAGVTEEIVGSWLSDGRRDRFLLATKLHGRTGPRPWHGGLSRAHVVAAAEASLRRLRTDHIDLYQLHRPDPLTPIEETLHALDDLVRAGKVRYIGCSNFLAYQVARALGRSALHDRAAFVSVQARYNLLFREHERELFPLCREEGLGVLAYNALAGGMLTGKHRREGGTAGGTRFADAGAGALYRGRYWHDDAFDAVDRIRALAGEAGLAMPVLATAWLRSRPGVTSVILGATRPDQLDLAAAAAAVELDDSLVAELDTLTARFRTGDAIQ
jgi:aryl-alcohol dehydrogenase (NADP+)